MYVHRMVWEQRVLVVMVIGDISEGVRVWPGDGEEEKHPLYVNNSYWDYGGLIVTGIKEYPGKSDRDIS